MKIASHVMFIDFHPPPRKPFNLTSYHDLQSLSSYRTERWTGSTPSFYEKIRYPVKFTAKHFHNMKIICSKLLEGMYYYLTLTKVYCWTGHSTLVD